MSDVLASVDLDSFRVQKIHDSQQLYLDPGDSEVLGIGGDGSTIRDPEQDMLSNIIRTLNDTYQTDFTEEDKVDIETIRRKVHADESLQQVIQGDNTDGNKRYKFNQVFDAILLEFVQDKLHLYNKLTKREVNDDLKRMLYQDYRQPSAPSVM